MSTEKMKEGIFPFADAVLKANPPGLSPSKEGKGGRTYAQN
jgi:hypothetical protein